MGKQLHVGVSRTAAEEAALSRAAETARSAPGTVLYLAPGGVETDRVVDRWTSIGRPIQIRIRGFDDIVAEVHEKHHFETRVSTLSTEERQRLVEVAVDSLDDTGHPLSSRGSLAGPETCSQSEDLLSLLEFARLTDPRSIRDDARLQSVSDDIRDALYELSQAFDTTRDRLAAARTDDTSRRQSIRSERYQSVVDDTTSLEAVLSNVDVVVLGHFPYFSPLEADLVEAISDVVSDVHATLPISHVVRDDPIDDSLRGIDSGAERAWRYYREMGFEISRVPDHSEDPAAIVASRLYRYTDEPPISSSTLLDAGIECHTYPNAAHEIRGTARKIRALLKQKSDGEPRQSGVVKPSDVGVVLTNPSAYVQEVFETFAQYNIRTRTTREYDLSETELGDAVLRVLRLGAGEATTRDLVRLVDNPLVSPQWPGTPLSSIELVRAGDAIESTDIDALTELLEQRSDDSDSPVDAVQWIETVCTELYETTAASVLDDLEHVFTELGIAGRSDEPQRTTWEFVADLSDRGWIADREGGALGKVRSIAESFRTTAPVVGRDGDPLGPDLRRAIETATVETSLGSPDGVEILSTSDVLHRELDYVFVLGLTQGNFPGESHRLAFTRSVNESHPDFAPSDSARQARYALGLQLVDPGSVVLSYPKLTPDGDETVVADFLAELDRVAEDGALSAIRDTQCDVSAPLASREDVQRRAATTLSSLRDAAGTEETPQARDGLGVVDEIVQSSTFDGAAGDPTTRLEDGVACATARRSPETTEFDGRLETETFEQFDVASAPLSPSRVDEYVACGFKFYANRVLDLGSDETYSRELDALDAGKFVHNVIARFFLSLQEHPGEPVEIDDPGSYHEALYDAAMMELNRPYVMRATSTFHDGWLTRLLAGLRLDDRENQYAGPEGYRGLLVRLVEALTEETSRVTSRPAFFEAGVGVADGEPGPMTVLNSDTEGPLTVLDPDPVSIAPESGFRFRGKVDRVDVVPTTDPRQFVAVDYKTGSTSSISDVVDGISFQLPLYLRMLESALDGDSEWQPIGAAYYELSIPDSAKIKKSPLASRAHTTYYRSAGKPLLRNRVATLFDYYDDPVSEVDLDLSSTESLDDLDEGDLFVKFLGETLESRLEEIGLALGDGVFHTTVLGERKAGCRSCDYAHVCDVRHHHHEDRLDEHGLENVYVPDAARDPVTLEENE